MSSVFGQSLSFPPRVGPDGRFIWSSGEANIRESIAVILKTEQGERVGVTDFGAGLARFLFEPNSPSTHASIQDAMVSALARWEPRIDVESVDVTAHPNDPEAALATITYRLIATGSRERINLAVALATS
jgi:phage baseplate assembly protein W